MRKIIHVDMDCFYAAVEEKFKPDLKSKPVGIGGPAQSRSVLCTANYEARKFGVRSAMPTSQAVRLCPNLILIPPHFDLYKQESRKVRKIFERFTDRIEPLSLDEAYLDVSSSNEFGGSATLIAREIRKQIQEELSLTASAGVAPNKFLAKIASDWRKPNGLFVIKPEDIADFMPPLKIEKIYGVGKVTAKKLHELGLFKCGDIQALTESELTKIFGRKSKFYRDLAFGLDQREVEPFSERKSLSVEETYSEDLISLEQAIRALPELYEEWFVRMEKGQYFDKIKNFQIKIKTSDFEQSTLEEAQTRIPTLKDYEKLLTQIWQRFHQPIRLIGIGVKLSVNELRAREKDERQLDLF
jgi:DNA polymerase-4